MIKRKGWPEVKKWGAWLEEHMTPEREALYRRHAQEGVAKGEFPVVRFGSVTSGSNLDWASSGSPMPLDGKIPEMDEVTRFRCWYCGGDNRMGWPVCIHCGAPLRSEE